VGRESIWSPDEDALLLQTAGHTAVQVNRLLSEAGFETRTPQQIKQRRSYLRRQQLVNALREPDGSAEHDPEVELVYAIQQRRDLTASREAIDHRIQALNQRIHELLTEVQDGQGV